MSAKKVAIGGKPSAKAADNKSVDAWIDSRHQEVTKAPTKRLTIDIPADLHARLKAECAMNGRKMVDEIRELLQEKYGKK